MVVVEDTWERANVHSWYFYRKVKNRGTGGILFFILWMSCWTLTVCQEASHRCWGPVVSVKSLMEIEDDGDIK